MYTSLHNHTHWSNNSLGFTDSIIKEQDLIQKAYDLGLNGVSITEHECVSSSIKAIQYYNSMKLERDFKLILGNEIYLLSEEEDNALRRINVEEYNNESEENYEETFNGDYYHFVLNALDNEGHKQIRELSSRAWKRAYKYKVWRRPTYYSDLEDVIKSNQGHVVGSTACFTKGQKVRTKRGEINIENITSNDFIMNSKGEWEKINYPTNREYKDKGNIIKFTKEPLPITCTKNHKFLIYDVKNKGLIWKEAQYLTKNDYCLEPIASTIYSNNNIIDIEDFKEIVNYREKTIGKQNYKKNMFRLPSKIKITNEVMRTFGLWLADGHISINEENKKYEVGFTFSKKEFNNYYNGFVDKALKEFGITKPYICLREEKNRVDLSINCVEFVLLFKNIFGISHAQTKHIPEKLKNISKDLNAELFLGYELGDGYFRYRKSNQSGEVVSASISNQLTKDFEQLCISLNLSGSITITEQKNDEWGNHKKSYYLTFYNAILGKKLQKITHISHEELMSLLYEATKEKRGKYDFIKVKDAKYRIKKVISNDKVEINETVYCLNTPSHNFVLNNIIVHNCLGGVIPHAILAQNYERANNAIQYFDDLFGHGNFYLEMQPCYQSNTEQMTVNKYLWDIGHKLDIPCIATTDSHYLTKESSFAHKVLLNAKDSQGVRETEDFYATTYLMNADELRDYLKLSFNDEEINTIFNNTNKIYDRVVGYNFEHAPIIPMIPLNKIPNFEKTDRYKEYYDKYTEFAYYANISLSECPYNALNDDLKQLIYQDQYFFYRIEKSLYELVEKKGKDVEIYIDRLNKEFKELRLISSNFDSSMASYYTCMSEIINIIWESDSFSMPSRGSGMGYLVCYLLEITQIDPVPLGDYAPHWRHNSAERGYSIPDIDDDSQNSRRESIIENIVKYFGEDRVLNVLTVSTLSAKTAIEKTFKGLKKLGLNISDDTIGYIKSLVPTERGQIWSLKDCFEGNADKGRKKVQELINEIDKYDGAKECALLFEGLIINRGIHASGVLIGNHNYVNEIACMRSPNGVLCSCYDLHDAEYCGWTKVDILTIKTSDKIRKTMDLLIEHGHMEWQGSLKKTYWKYLHPDVLDYDTYEMWEMIKQIYSIFQFDTPVAVKSLNQVEPHSVMDLSATNSLLRLMAENGKEAPLSKYVRYKNNIQSWYDDMTEYGLTKEEQEVLKEHLSGSYGLADSQEKAMLLSMDNRISGFTLKESNNLRKAIAKKRADVLEQTKAMFFEKGKELGTSDKMLNYVWEEEFAMSFGYSFSQLHSYAYSVIALQELNLNYYYPSVYWNTACLTIESQSDEQDGKGNADYGKIAKAIYKMKKFGVEVLQPNINKSDISFTPNEEDNTILFGLGGISGINTEIAKVIIDKRPYKNFDDFYEKHHFKGSLITKSKFITLIKSGCFDETDDRITTMKWLSVYENPKKESLTTANIDNAIKLGVTIDKELLKVYKFKKYVLSNQFFYCNDPKYKSKKHYLVEEEFALPYFQEICMDNLKEEIDYYYTNEGLIVVDKSLEKALSPYMDKLKDLINTQEFIDEYNKLTWKNAYIEMCGTEDVNKWSFESISFYANSDHELNGINYTNYNISHFNDLSEEPTFIEKSYGKRSWKQYNIARICGTVLDRKDNDHFINILTPDNEVVSVKFNDGQYNYYKQTISNEFEKDENYFKRGTMLMISGYRRGEDEFVAKRYKNSVFCHTLIKIKNVNADKTLDLQLNRLGEDEDDN